MINLILHCTKIVKKFNRDEMTVYAAQASFFIVIAAFPFIMLLLTLIQLVPGLGKADLMATLTAMMPDIFHSLIINVVNDLYTQSPATILSITAITALWSASKGMLSIERGLNKAYDIQKKRNYIVRRLICSGYTIIFMIVCIVCLVLLVFGTSIQNLVVQKIPLIAKATGYVISFRNLLAMALLIACFAGFYTYIPQKKQNLKLQVPGAIFSTICWLVFSYVFSLYFENFKKFSYMYGSLTAIVLLLLWLYVCICILFLGAEINHYLGEEPEHYIFQRNT